MRCGYTEDSGDSLALGRWRAQVESAIRGKRGQAFLRSLIAALDALPEKKLVRNALESPEGSVCALGALGKQRGVNLSEMDTYDYYTLGKTFNIAPQLAQETMYVNDEAWAFSISDEERWQQVRGWATKRIVPTEEELTGKAGK